jgi:hypothetical protein
MAARGFSYWVGPIESVHERRSAVYVVDDLTWVRKHGFGGRLVRAAERAGNPNFAYVNAFPREDRVRYTRTLEGMRSDRVSVGELYGDYETWSRVSPTPWRHGRPACANPADRRQFEVPRAAVNHLSPCLDYANMLSIPLAWRMVRA